MSSSLAALLDRFFYRPDEEVGSFLELAPEIDRGEDLVPDETPEEFLAFVLEGETYADEPILKLLTVHLLTKVDYAVGPLTLAWIRRDDPLPEQQGRLYQLRHDDGARGIAPMVEPLLKTGALRFVGGWASWDALDDEPSHVHYRPFGKGPGALLPPGLEAIL